MFSAPQFQFIAFPNRAPKTATDLAALDDDAKRALLAAAEVRAVLTRTKFFTNVAGTNTQMITAPNSNTHYYVRLDALGSLGAMLPLVVESLNGAGQPLPPPGPNR